uniref:VWFA domain-containing protein n=1 Tax=Anabas testudineus TaxID=64144 RepID=A0A7N6B9M9_ANATE
SGAFQMTFLFIYSIPVSLSFNIEITNPSVYTGKKEDFFGYKVLQFTSGSNKGIIVTAPLQLNGTGGVCNPGQNLSHPCFNSQEISVENQMIPVKHLGLSIAADPKGSNFTVCSPSVAHECDENSYLNSVCYTVTYDLQQASSSTPAFKECRKKTVDLVFLFDGSGSMTEAEFNKNKDFIVDIINSLKNSSIKFAAVQFSTYYSKVFDFNDYQAGTALDKLHKEPHMKTLTNTHRALRFVLEDILENPAAGASADATKVLVLITDGDPSDTDRYGIIQRYDEMNIIRFVIMVKAAKQDKFTHIASQPTVKYAFKIENYDGLTGILENFQKQIFEMEGSKAALAGNMTNEMSQSGFSAVVYNGALILGSVGSNGWRGSLQEFHNQKETQIEDPDMQVDSYMGYSISVAKKNNDLLYFTGAPRFEHSGQVTVFRQNDTKWTPAQSLKGDMIGSYFGAELCSVDIDSDGNTDFLLVGAPLFYHPQEKREGQIYVYTLTDEMQLTIEQNVTVSSMGRFGTSISSIADLNGDGLRDVAVGAPLEDDNSGAVYIYLGDRRTGIRSTFSQRIMGQRIKPGLRLFGQAIDGTIDMGEDGLPDIVIGSQGTAVVLRSKPVFNVTSRLSFLPGEIVIEKFDCTGGNKEVLPMVTLTVCFEMTEVTKSKKEVTSSGLNISYTLDVDPMRQTYRGLFSSSDNKARSITSSCVLRDDETCLNHTIYMPTCVKDLLSPVSVKLNLTQTDSDAENVLNVDSEKQAIVEIPFERQCRKNDTCIADLVVDFNFLTPTLLVAENNKFDISVKLSNPGDDSYNTSLIMHYPAGLSFSMMVLTESTRPTLHRCDDLKGVLDKTVCGVSRPVYRRGSSVSHTAPTQQTEVIDNANATSKSSMTKNIAVQFEIKMEVTIDNPGSRSFPVHVSVVFPAELDYNFEMKNYQVLVEKNKTQCTNVKSNLCPSEKSSKIIKCDPFILDKATELKLIGDVHFKDLKQHAANLAFLKRYVGDGGKVKFKSFIHVSYDEKRYVLDSGKKEVGPTVKWTEIQVEFIIPVDQQLIVLTGVVLGLLFLIILTVIMWKMGCFKRRKLPDTEERESLQSNNYAPSQPTPVPTTETNSKSNNDSKSEEPSEENKPLKNNEANDSTS